jgi:hypothetical protein
MSGFVQAHKPSRYHRQRGKQFVLPLHKMRDLTSLALQIVISPPLIAKFMIPPSFAQAPAHLAFFALSDDLIDQFGQLLKLISSQPAP